MNDFQRAQARYVDHFQPTAVVWYRAFLLDINDRVFAVRLLITKDHEAALRLAQRIQTQCDMIEVWHGTTKLGLIAPRNRMP